MSRFVRASKYRHVYGSPEKREKQFDNIKISASAWDTDIVAANPRFLAVNCHTSGGGAFLVVPLSKPGKIPDIYPLVRGHSGPVLDTAWSPFDDELIASGGEDSKVQLTRINEDALLAAWQEGVEVQDIKPLPVNLSHGGKKVGNVQWHPTAQGVLATSAADIRLWDVENQTATIVLQAHPDLVQSFSFNSTGSLLATTCKDKKLRLFDIRASTLPVQTAESHSGVKGSRVVWLGNLDRMVTTGFSRMSDRQVFLWNAGSLDKPIKQMTIDTSSGTLMPFWSDNNVLFLAGKGDGNIRYYEYDHDDLIYLTEHKSSDPQRGMTFLPRRGLNVAECEIARAYKVLNAGVEPISFIVPRKSESFQSDIFPPAASSNPAMSASEFFDGKTSQPIYIDLESGQPTSAAPAPPSSSPVKQASRQTSTASFKATSPVDAPSPSHQKDSAPSTAKPVREEPKESLREEPKETSPVVERQPLRAATMPASDTTGQSSTNEETEKLKGDNKRLENELAEAMTTIRKLEIKVERLTLAHKKAQEAYADI